MDINMPVMDGITCTRHITEKYKNTRVLVLTMTNEQEHIKNMIEAGAGGYILKNSGKEELILAIETILSGKNYFSDEVKDIIMHEMVTKKSKHDKLSGEPVPLTRREKDVLKLIVQEFTNFEIAEKLFISVRTVDAHRRNLLEKTGARNTAGLVKYAIENNLTQNNH
jgi:DNA-binding NarL/FixJ family response regulator